MCQHAAQALEATIWPRSKYSFLRAAPAVSFLHGFHIHPCYDAGNAEDGPTRVLHLGSLLTLS